MRDVILLLIKNIEENINIKMKESGIYGKLIWPDVSPVRIEPVRIVISGGSGFNNLIEKENRPVSPDIDVKLCLHTQEAIDLHEHMTQVIVIEDIESLQMEVARQLLIVRTHLFNVMEDKAKEFSELIIQPQVNKFNNMFKNLYQYCKTLMVEEMAGKDIPFLKSLDPNENEKGIWKKEFNENTVKVLVRETLMKRGIDGEPEENNPYKLHDVFLYSLDLPFNGKTGFDSLAGILDIVVSIPGHIGYILPYHCRNDLQDTQNCYNITVEYYTEELNKLLKYGLRTKNEKILKDLVRYKILLISQNKIPSDDITKTVTNIYNSLDNDDFKYAIQLRMGELANLNSPLSQELSSQDLIFDSQDSEYYYNTNNHLKNLDEQCQDVISQSSEDSDYDEKMRQMYIDLYADIDENGSLQQFANECMFHDLCGQGGGSKKKKQIGGAPCGNVEMLSLSKVFQLMVNNKSMEGFINFNNIKLVLDKNDFNFNKITDSVPKINFEKLTQIKAENPNPDYPNPDDYIISKLDQWTNEYLSTKASERVVPFRMSAKAKKDITKICNHLINEVIITNKNINRLCYCYESDDYKPENKNAPTPTRQEYAAFLLTQCQVLNTIDVTKELYNVIDMIKKGYSEEDIKKYLIKNKGPSHVIPQNNRGSHVIPYQ